MIVQAIDDAKEMLAKRDILGVAPVKIQVKQSENI